MKNKWKWLATIYRASPIVLAFVGINYLWFTPLWMLPAGFTGVITFVLFILGCGALDNFLQQKRSEEIRRKRDEDWQEQVRRDELSRIQRMKESY